uniref:PAS domain-containing protein n=1 Tax=Parastrongyloides trichosuri TaxID=131310 RepID=A0A0N4ZP85_PARTI
MEKEDNNDTQRKNTIEKRRESSKCAARERRGKETCIFDELKYEVPVVSEPTITHVDRIALLRVAATLCRLRRSGDALFVENNLSKSVTKFDNSLFNETSLYETLDGFIFIVDSDDTILYSTESISMYLGLTQTDVVGHPLKEYCHQEDHEKLINTIHILRSNENLDNTSSICLRLKTVVSPRGRNLNLKSAIMKSTVCNIKCLRLSSGWLSLLYISTEPVGHGSITQNVSSLAKNFDESNGTFITRHTCDMKFSFVGDNFNSLLKKDNRSMVGTSFYDLIHPSDVCDVGKSIKHLFETGHAQTFYYRLIAPEDSVNWMITIANTVKHTSKGQKGQYVICLHYYLGSQSEKESFNSPLTSEGEFLLKTIIYSTKYFPALVKNNRHDNEDFIGLAPKFVPCSDFIPRPSACLPLFLEEDSIPNSSIKRKSSYKALLAYLIDDSECFTLENERSNYGVPNKIRRGSNTAIRATRRPFFTTSFEGSSPESVDSGFDEFKQEVKQEYDMYSAIRRNNHSVILSDFHDQYQDNVPDDVCSRNGIYEHSNVYSNVSTPNNRIINYDDDIIFNSLNDFDSKGRAPYVSVDQITQLESDDSLLEFFLPSV